MGVEEGSLDTNTMRGAVARCSGGKGYKQLLTCGEDRRKDTFSGEGKDVRCAQSSTTDIPSCVLMPLFSEGKTEGMLWACLLDSLFSDLRWVSCSWIQIKLRLK